MTSQITNQNSTTNIINEQFLMNQLISHSSTLSQQILTMLFVSGSEEIKNFIKYISNLISQNYLHIINSPFIFVQKIFYYIKYIIKYLFKKQSLNNTNPIKNYIPQIEDNSILINVKVFENIAPLIIKFLFKNNGDITYCSNHEDILISTSGNISKKYMLSSFKFEYKNMVISCNILLNFTVDINDKNKICLKKFIINPDNVESLVDIFSPGSDIHNMLSIFHRLYPCNYSSDKYVFYNNINYSSIILLESNHLINFDGSHPIGNMLNSYILLYQYYIKIYKNMIFSKFINEFLLITSYLKAGSNIMHEVFIHNIYNKMNINNNIIDIKSINKITNICSCFPINIFDYFTSYSNIIVEIYKVKNKFNMKEFEKYIEDICNTKLSYGDNDLYNFPFKVINYDEKNFNDMINNIFYNRIDSSIKIKIYSIKYIQEIINTELDNPDYIKLKQIINEYESSDKLNQSLIEIKKDLIKIPEKIIKQEIKNNITTKLITEKYKNFNTLYLRQNNYEELIYVINKYKSNKIKLLELGLPDKLGIFLYGLPGTGKTSTIWAIATALNLNIFYLDLENIKTNNELTDIFNHINSANCGGGIIVIEDIDAMTDVVLKRTTQSTNSSSLTLSHLLNLLQGALTQDGTIFIITTNHKDKLDPALFREGRFDVQIEMKNADRYQCNQIYKNFLSRELSIELLNKLPEDTFTPAKFIFYLSNHLWSDDISDEEIINNFLLYLQR